MKSMHIAPIGLAAAVACALTSCGSAGQVRPGAEPERPGCSTTVAPIAEPTYFASYQDRLTPPPLDTQSHLKPFDAGSGDSMPLGLPPVVGEFSATATQDVAGHVTVVFRRDSASAKSGSNASYKDGSVLLSFTPIGSSSSDIAHALKDEPDGGDRVNLVAVGSFDAAVTWADPDATGMRTHNVIWTDPGRGGYFTIEALMGPEELVRLARELVCDQ